MGNNKIKQYKYIKRLSWLILAVLLVPVQALFSQDTAESQNTGTIKFTDILNDTRISSDYRTAVEEYEKSILEMELYKHPGDFGINFTPGAKFQWPDLETPVQTDVNLDAGVSLFLGRSPVLEEKYQTAVRNIETSRLQMDATLNEVAAIFYNLYSDLWLLQQEGFILEKEKLLAEERYSGAYQMYVGGSASISDLEDADETLRLAEDSLQANALDQRLTWFSLQQYRGKAINDQNMALPVLEKFWFDTPVVEKPSLISERAVAANYDILKLQNALLSLQETASRLKEFNMGLNLKPFVGYDDYLVNMSYNLESRALNINSEIPLINLNASSTQDSQKKWSTGLTVVLDIDSGKTDDLETRVLEKEIIQQEILLKKQIDKSDLELRSVYQQLQQARQTLELSENAYQRQVRLKEAVSVRFDSGSALKTDLLSADIALQRSLWKINSARVGLQRAYLNYLVLRGELPF